MAVTVGAIDDATLRGVGLAQDALERWRAAEPSFARRGEATAEAFEAQRAQTSAFLSEGEALLAQLPPKPQRSEREAAAADSVRTHLRQVRRDFLRRYAGALYAELTDNLRTFVRIEELVYLAAERTPGLVPTRAQVQADRTRQQKDKEGYEIDQGIFLEKVLSETASGTHLVYAMLRPKPESLALLQQFQRAGKVDIGSTTVERRDRVGYVWHGNPRFLNAEDDPTTSSLETAIDLVLLDPAIDVGVLRGKVVEHAKYAGRRIFSAGINLTHLYHGQISFVDFFIVRDMGLVHKIYRGLSRAEYWPEDVEDTLEKPWIAAVEGFAIGGGCQLLLAMDYVLAEANTYFNLPARKEGIIPGVSNMRLWRFVGDRAARQAIMFDRRFPATSPGGRLICDRVVAEGQMDWTLEQTLQQLATSGVVSAAGNRKAMRIGQETVEQFRQYMAVYCREQAECHYSPQLIRNLEQNWAAHQRAP